MRAALLPVLASAALALPAAGADKPDPLKAAVERAEKAVKDSPTDAAAHLKLGAARLAARDNEGAVTALTRALELDPKLAEAQDRRGDAYLKLGRFAEAVADFDAVLKAHPTFAPKHWRRGIALYYAGKHADGVKQFELHKTDNPQDVENAAWHYLCNVKVAGKDAARKALIAVTDDARVPMAEIQKLFAGQRKPEDVLAAAERVKAGTPEGTSARFYAHLYVGLWYEAEGEPKKVLEHLAAAVEKHEVPDYMWDVGNAHLKAVKAKR
jgi:lipoprotein NlpI